MVGHYGRRVEDNTDGDGWLDNTNGDGRTIRTEIVGPYGHGSGWNRKDSADCGH